jgi:hypothetical protein
MQNYNFRRDNVYEIGGHIGKVVTSRVRSSCEIFMRVAYTIYPLRRTYAYPCLTRTLLPAAVSTNKQRVVQNFAKCCRDNSCGKTLSRQQHSALPVACFSHAVHGCGTWSLTLNRQHRLRVFVNIVLR